MKLNSYFKKGSILTCTNGWLQTTDKGIAFLEYFKKAANLSFAVDAKAFIEASKVLTPDFKIIRSNKGIILFDNEQEVTLLHQPEDLSLKDKIPTEFIEKDLANYLAKANEFTSPDYPGIRTHTNYLEVVTSECIIRIRTNVQLPSKILLAYKLPKNSTGFYFAKEYFWLKYHENCYIALSYLNVSLPNTNNFFGNWGLSQEIPQELYKKLSSAETVQFTQRGLHLKTEKIADTVIEDIIGTGTYTYGAFSKLIKHGRRWVFTPQTINIIGTNFFGVLENKQNA